MSDFASWICALIGKRRYSKREHNISTLRSSDTTMVSFRRTSGEFRSMDRKDVLLAALSAVERPFSPVHLQKALFIINDKLPHIFGSGERYCFEPYDYGPFDQRVYADADTLKLQGLIQISREPDQLYRHYAPTKEGRERGQKLLASMPPPISSMVRRIVEVITSMPFRELVSSVYRAYPHMKVNSVFKEPT